MKTSQALLALSATACAPTPRLETAIPIASSSWSQSGFAASTATVTPTASLGRALGSVELEALIARALAASPRLLIARERVEEARALARSARSTGLRLVGVASGSRPQSGGFGIDNVDVNASFAPDLSGERRASNRAARARADAVEEDRQADTLRLTTEIAQNYVQSAALAQRLTLVDRSIAQSSEVERVVGLRVREGEASRVDLGLQAVRAGRLKAERARLAGAADQTRIALALLVGAESPGFIVHGAQLAALTAPEPHIPSPHDLTLVRADLRAAEARLQAAGGDVSAARRAFFPSFDISIGQIAGAGLTGGISLAADLLGPIFNGARLKGSLEAASARQRAAAFDYRRAMLSAIAEVDGAMTAVATARTSAQALSQNEDQAKLTLGLARRRYLEGEAGLQELLDAQDLLIAAEDASVLARQAQLDAGIALWLATGVRVE